MKAEKITTDIHFPLDMVAHWAGQSPETPYLHQPVDGSLKIFSWGEVYDSCLRLAGALQARGYKTGDRIAILSKNCAEWVIADLACQAAGLVSVPVYPTASAETVSAILDHSEAKAVFVGKLDDPDGLSEGIPQHVARFAMPYPTVSAGVAWSDMMAEAPGLDAVHKPRPEDLMTIIYTSGSTGMPKGVMLSFGAYARTAKATRDAFDLDENGRLLSHLPLAHIADRSVGLGASLYAGAKIFFAESIETFQRDMQTCRPTHFSTVPRLWMKFQAGLLSQMPQERLDLLLRVPGIRSMVKKKVKKALGLDQAKLFGAGAAPISPAVIDWFSRLDIPIAQGYGMSETAGLNTTVWPLRLDKLETVGTALDGFEVKVDETGEVLIRGVGLFTGYYKEPEMTAEVFDGTWIRTGDRGHIDADGYLRITGRAKEIFKTAKGKYVAPAPIEALLAEDTNLEQICVLGAGLSQPAALVVLSPSGRGRDRATVQAELKATLASINERLEPHERVGQIIILHDLWTPENGLLTPTFKIKRAPIEDRFGLLAQSQSPEPILWESDIRGGD